MISVLTQDNYGKLLLVAQEGNDANVNVTVELADNVGNVLSSRTLRITVTQVALENFAD